MSVRKLLSAAAVAAVCLTTLVAVDVTPAAASTGPSWALSPSANTSPTQDNSFNSVSCTSTASCVAVGYARTTGTEQTLVQSWNGTTWTILPSPNTSTSLANFLQGVSCASPTACVAVGSATTGSNSQTLIESWNGTAWSLVPSPNTSPTLDNYLYSVSCTSPSACVAVGSADNGTAYQTLIETWNGSAWTITPSPSASASLRSDLYGVSCTSPTWCVAVGHANSGTVYQALVETWNGSAWTITPSASPSPTLSSIFESVSCTSSTACVAVGFADSGTNTRTFISNWNGTTWAIMASPNPSATLGNYLYGVSCTSSTACVAVGSTTSTDDLTLIETWDGSAWTVTPSPSAPSPNDNDLYGVSCPSLAGCVAAGAAYGSNIQTLAVTAIRAGGYRLVASDGGIFAYGGSPFLGSMGGMHLNQPIVGMAATPDDLGYWLVASDGGVFAFGSARFYGSMGATRLNKPIVGMAAAPDGRGYWLVASDGGVFAFGSAGFAGSAGAVHQNTPNVGKAATTDGTGYWLAASDGGVFAYGGASFQGSTATKLLNAAVVGIAASPVGTGYWLVAADGGVFSFGSAVPYGSTGGIHLNQPIVGMSADQTGRGYWLVASDGGVFAFGDAPFAGSTGGTTLNKPIVGVGG